jgi:hypothetical protein
MHKFTKSSEYMKNEQTEIPDTLNILVQLKGDEVARFIEARDASVFARRTRVNGAFARNLLLERIAQIAAPPTTSSRTKTKAT